MVEEILKVVVIGEFNCGKSWLISSFLGKDLDSIQTTIGIHFHAEKLKIDGKDLKVQIWDTAGQDKFRAVRQQFYRHAKAVALVYDVTNYASFQNIEKWYDELKNYLSTDYVAMLIGNKMDLTDQRQVPTEEGENYARNRGFFFIETSALTKENVEVAFRKLVEESYKNWHLKNPKPDSQIIKIQLEKEKKKCCFF